ncbi:MAG: PEP-CTERM sorting domain-containing protein [Abditibacteriota bacterium]|nr:PEP-CTERM sorting domain-containing protein [Abditibacteriota bacterium]MBP5092491.1 PEP-CTERM sorting domain-containing protein [Abditibacteriota bacterium]MBP5738350.1 PEP-CTERM sorting domain-containing protein [Abditibacteriota bacterium]
MKRLIAFVIIIAAFASVAMAEYYKLEDALMYMDAGYPYVTGVDGAQINATTEKYWSDASGDYVWAYSFTPVGTINYTAGDAATNMYYLLLDVPAADFAKVVKMDTLAVNANVSVDENVDGSTLITFKEPGNLNNGWFLMSFHTDSGWDTRVGMTATALASNNGTDFVYFNGGGLAFPTAVPEVPEPGTFAALALGCAGLASFKLRKK